MSPRLEGAYRNLAATARRLLDQTGFRNAAGHELEAALEVVEEAQRREGDGVVRSSCKTGGDCEYHRSGGPRNLGCGGDTYRGHQVTR